MKNFIFIKIGCFSNFPTNRNYTAIYKREERLHKFCTDTILILSLHSEKNYIL